MKLSRFKRVALAVLATVAVASAIPTPALIGPKGDTPEEKRETVRKKSEEMLTELYRLRPELRNRLPKAAGYATFSSLAYKLMVTSSARGYGVVVDNTTGKETFMKMASFGVGAGAGIKDQRLVIIFKNRDLMNRFVEKGWQFGADAETGIKVDNEGASAGLSGSSSSGGSGASADVKVSSSKEESAGTDYALNDGMEIYQFTENGVSLSATVGGTKYWKDSKLNQ
jgi:lipid-binding SYLF domain-containing protein